MSNVNLRNLELFFDYDLKIKNIMLNMAFKEEYAYNKDSLIEYEDKILKSLEEIKYYLYVIISNFGENKELLKLDELFINIQNEFINAPLNPTKLKEVYRKNISDMRDSFIDTVNKTFKGYSCNIYDEIKPTSINEYLHLIHARIVNNEEIYQSMPKINNDSSNVNLYGEDNIIANNIYKNIVLANINSDYIDILSLKSRILIMARDLGHALMIEISFEQEKAYVNYFIPKVCNYIKVNNLKGINSVDKDSVYAKGIFEVDINKLPYELTNLMLNVPNDEDMFEYGGLCYQESNNLNK
jgi:hypothetical protein